MSNKQKITYLLEEVKRLEELLSGIREAEIYPVSFFNQSFDLTRELLKELYRLEEQQVETLRKQMEARQAILRESLLQTSVYTTSEEEEPTGSPEPEITAQPEIEPAVEEVIEEIVTEPVIQEPVKEEKSIEELLKEYAPAEPVIPDKTPPSLSELIEKKNLSDFRKAFSLNDRFYFLRELFEGDDQKMNEAVADLNEIESLEESLDYLNNKMRWNPEEAPVADFIHLLEKRFS